ncbi:MMPL family transporter [Pseudofrankia sp. BMG5.37]|uniref:MMPL family transporter n=1 Tax=Pseudofrankia sp. BMG5.37 TaxID=3050035 RepID=UPI0028948C81|nr:MMPL family transporter [Pseudofrankia sp. BMG5.37]MDT3440138.1 MMPL family transporter [Pseudofrankia sp. BMG5.37]
MALGAILGVVGSNFTDSSRLPASDSSTAYSLLAKGGSDAASAKTGTIVWHTETGSAVSAATRSTIAPMLQKVSTLGGVTSVISPFTSDGAAQVSADDHTAYATVVFTSTSHADQAKDIAKHADTGALKVQVGGTAFTNPRPSEISEIVGVLAALLVLLLVFRSVWAALLPILTGVAGVAVSSLAVMLLSHVMTLPTVAPSMGALIGLGVGIDYALFIVNRQRKALRAGVDLTDAITTAMNTSGRAVLFAGGTVMIALLGMLILNVGFLSGMAVAAALTVLLTVAAAVTLLPALLAKIGPRVLRRSERRATNTAFAARGEDGGAGRRTPADRGGWARWARLVERRPVATGTAAVAVLVILAAPALALRLGAADASSDPTGTNTRGYHDTMASAFGDGFQAQLLLVAETPNGQAQQAWSRLIGELPHVKGVASVGSPVAVTANTLAMVEVVPTTTAQDKATTDLVHTLRSDVITHTEMGTDLRVHVGGTTASSIDFANALTGKLPLFLVIIAGLGFLLLTLAFRSLLVPAVGAIGNLLTIAVALGATVALFQWGWGPSLFGIGGPAPVEYVVAILIVGVMFGLSMDYHVFLVSRMHEEWVHTQRNRRAVTVGVGETGQVVATAASIMACVFAAFGFAGVRTISEFGVGLAIAVLVDAFLLRMTVIPALMHLCGARNWAIPAWLDRILPHMSVEGGAETRQEQEIGTQPVPEPEPVDA